MKKMRPALYIVLALALALSLLCGCGAASMADDSASGNSESTAPMAPAPDANGGYEYGYDFDAPESTEEDMAASEELGASGSSNPLTSAKLIYTAYLDMETTEFDAAVASLEDLVRSLGGYFESSSVDNYGTYRYANYTVRVPAESFDAFCETAGTLCQLNNIYRNAQDVSEYYYDTEARLATQQTKLERLQELLAQAENMEDIITIESAISETELQIENLTGTLRKYDSLVGYSTVDISLCEVYTLTEVQEPVIGFGAKLAQAFQSGCTNFVKGLQWTLLSIARNWTGWLIFLVIAAVVVVFAVRYVRRRRQRRSEALARREEAAKKKDGGESK